MQCDVIIPTYNSAAVLPRALEALFEQHVPAEWQCRVLISDDGSTDETVAIAEATSQRSGWRYEVIQNEHRGRAATRNTALECAAGDIIYFLQDDILLRPGALAAHLTFHEQHSEAHDATLGTITWDPRLSPSPFMEWMVHSGPQNDFDALLGQSHAQLPNYFYGANLSLKHSLLGSAKFAENFTEYGWEDYELGLRLAQRGLRLAFTEEAVALHAHHYSMEAIRQRQRAVGREMVTVQRLHPNEELPRKKMLAQRWKYRLASFGGLVALLGFILSAWPSLSWPWAFKVVTTGWFWEGYLKGLNKGK